MPRKNKFEMPDHVDEREVNELEQLYAMHQQIYSYMCSVSARLHRKYGLQKTLDWNDRYYAGSAHFRTKDIIQDLHELMRTVKEDGDKEIMRARKQAIKQASAQ